MLLSEETDHIVDPLKIARKPLIKQCLVGGTQVRVPGFLALGSWWSENAEPRLLDIRPIRWWIVPKHCTLKNLLPDEIRCRAPRKLSIFAKLEGQAGVRDWYADSLLPCNGCRVSK